MNNSKGAGTYLKMYDVGVRDANTVLIDETSPEAVEVGIKVLAASEIVMLRLETNGEEPTNHLAYLEGFRDRMMQADENEPQLHEQFEEEECTCHEGCNLEGGPAGSNFIVIDFRAP